MGGITEPQPPNSPGSVISSVRIHSPYCEATGPIVQEGFVASRVRALQGLQIQSPRPSIHSHSPLTPCPIPKTAKMHEPLTPLLRRTLQPSVTIKQSSDTKSSDCLQRRHSPQETPNQDQANPTLDGHNHEQPRRRPPAAAPHAHDYISAKLKSSSLHNFETYESEKEIFSPQAMPPELAKPSYPSDSLGHNEEHQFRSSCPRNVVGQRRSIADKLGAMVECGWVGCDVFGKAYNERQDPGPDPPVIPVGRNKTLSRSSSAPCEKQPFHRADESSPACKTEIIFQQCASCDDRCCKNKVGSSQGAYHFARRNGPYVTESYNTAITATRRSTTDATASAESDRAVPKPIRPGRAWTLHYPHRSHGSGGHPIKLRTLSPCHSLDLEPHQLLGAGNWETRVELPQEQDPSRHGESHQQRSPPASQTPDSCVSSLNMQQTKRSDPRTSSLLGSLLAGRWLKMVTVDRKPQLQGLSRRDSAHVLNDMMKPDALAECGHEDAAEEPKPTERSVDLDKDSNPKNSPTGKLPNAVANPITDKASANRSLDRRTTPALPTLNSTFEDLSTPPIQLEAIVKGPITKSPERRAPASVQSTPNESRPAKSPVSVRVDHMLKGKGIKKVQVVVSLDGADELVVEARLLRTLDGYSDSKKKKTSALTV